MINELKQYFDKTLILTADQSKIINPKTIYHLYKEECLELNKTICEKNYFMDKLADYIFEYMGNTNEKLVLSVNALVYERYFYEIKEMQNNKCDDKSVKDDLLKDNDHTFTIKTGRGEKNNTKWRVCIFSTMGKKYDMDKIKAHKDKKENVEVVHCCISSEAMKILSDFVKIHEEAYDEKASLLEEYHKEYDNE